MQLVAFMEKLSALQNEDARSLTPTMIYILFKTKKYDNYHDQYTICNKIKEKLLSLGIMYSGIDITGGYTFPTVTASLLVGKKYIKIFKSHNENIKWLITNRLPFLLSTKEKCIQINGEQFLEMFSDG